jgi:hypothetical protein
MAITPIDLQTLFTQVDKAGKIQSPVKEGQIIHETVHNIQIQKKTEDHTEEVNQTKNMGEGAQKVNDQTKNNQSQNQKRNKQNEPEKEQAESLSGVFFTDPRLGKNIDISL